MSVEAFVNSDGMLVMCGDGRVICLAKWERMAENNVLIKPEVMPARPDARHCSDIKMSLEK